MSKVSTPEKCCLICGQALAKDTSSFGLFRGKEQLICGKCRQGFVPSKKKHVLYEYNDFFRSVLFRYKALGDLALAPVFLDGQTERLKRKYRGYVIIAAPSHENDNLKRGFATLPWIFRPLGLEMIQPFYKTCPYKQASAKHRTDIYQVIAMRNTPPISQRKVLLVDDVITSGHTLQACRALLEPYQPARIEILVLAGKSQTKNIKKRGYKK